MIRVAANPSHALPTIAGWSVALLLTRVSAACAVLALSACTLLPAPREQQTYTLPAFTPVARTAASTAWSLRVNTPFTTAPLDSRQVIVQRPNASLASYHGIRWADRAPVLLRDRLVQALSDSSLFTAVVSDRNAILPTDVELSMTLGSFQLIHADGRAHATIRMQTQLIDTRGPHLLGHQAFAHVHAVDDPADPDAVIAAFGRATDALAEALATWVASLAPGTPS